MAPNTWARFVLRVIGGVMALEIEGRTAFAKASVPGSPAGFLALYSAKPPGAVAYKDLWIRELGPDGKPSRERPWRSVFDGKSLDWMQKSGRSAWRLANGGLEPIPGTPSGAQSVEEFSDGQFRFRFEVNKLSYLELQVRHGTEGQDVLALDRSGQGALLGRVNEAVFTCRGMEVTATLNGRPVELLQRSEAARGRLFVHAPGEGFRLLSIEYRDLN
jgi:hypothetical protein